MFQLCEDYLSDIEAKHEERMEEDVSVTVNPGVNQNRWHRREENTEYQGNLSRSSSLQGWYLILIILTQLNTIHINKISS